ncbi:MAG: dihydroorotate dehydrogenase electron transfer subunit [Defluviitaleaceae bacterium]|nr:dihydroorotate dehydrogenase electron transfer subunit [Defluviitaleaceae bacterium]
MNPKHYETAKVISNSHAYGVYSMKLEAPQVAADSKPGQFVMVYLGSDKHLLPRPISLYDVDKAAGTITLDYIVPGAGTKIISEWPVGHNLQILGPLGNGFDLENLGERVALVGGGIGIAPLYFLAKELNGLGIKTDVYLGFRQEIPRHISCFETLAQNIKVATEDGRGGNRGYITDFLPRNPTYDTILSCGPIPMLKALARYAHSHNIPCQVSVEERMACGLGACKGCVVKTLVGYQLCCQNGPVFKSDEIFLPTAKTATQKLH